ncbi:MAG: hypothetical protein K0Q60_4800 [Microvirga sp.]|nr:hypothetical protein [Microvirga sp.]
MNVAALRGHIERLAAEHDIVVYAQARRPAQAYALRDAEEIFIAPVRSHISYAVALHELGHFLGRYQTSRHTVVREQWAWNWARASALIWTPAMERHARKAMAYIWATQSPGMSASAKLGAVAVRQRARTNARPGAS